jgi:hypothetical protein
MIINLLLFTVVWNMKNELKMDGGGITKKDRLSEALLLDDDEDTAPYDEDIIGGHEGGRNVSMASVSSIASLHENIEKVRSISVA